MLSQTASLFYFILLSRSWPSIGINHYAYLFFVAVMQIYCGGIVQSTENISFQVIEGA
jgi:hypothetical protein